MTRFKLFDTAQGSMDLENNINEWLMSHPKAKIISANLTWDQSNLVYTILYTDYVTKDKRKKDKKRKGNKTAG